MRSQIQYVRPGIALLVTLVLLVVLSTLMFTLSTRMSAQRHRDHYIIDYQAARYACDSAVKYALATLDDMNTPLLIERPNEPDFSDLFMLGEEQYREYLAEWSAQKEADRLAGEGTGRTREKRTSMDSRRSSSAPAGSEPNDVNDFNDISSTDYAGTFVDSNDPNSWVVPGPYGPPWPFISEPIEFEVGSAKVRIEIEDENAKYPIGWAIMDDEKVRREATAGFETFCEWMEVNEVQIDSLIGPEGQLKEISKIKPFKIDFKPVTRLERKLVKTPTTSRTSRSRTRAPRMQTVRTTESVAQQIAKQSADFARLCHSSLIDTEALARPTIISESRKESALKYMGMWASMKVNINTAPRHVLEAAFIFGGDADQIAEEIIQRRRIKPFANMDELKQELFRYSSAIEKCEKYITTVSRIFTIKITVVSGVAKASAVIGVMKDGKKIQRIAVISS
ncbi:MAG TPA: type II secretion system protein GspK [Sedimentisphaerales bacterium]|nr:type II secretion system protein GspK [Sedimentisphaerales bacterium]